MRLLNIVLSHAIFISLCAVTLCCETYYLLHLPINFAVIGFVFFATLTSYNFYWILSKLYFSNYVFKNINNSKGHLAFIFIGIIGLLFSFYLSLINLNILSISVGLTALYSLPLLPFAICKKLQQFGFFKTFVLALTWTFVTFLLPLNKVINFEVIHIIFFVCRFLFMYMLCLMFDLRDVKADKAKGFESIATTVNRNNIGKIFLFILFTYVLFFILFFIVSKEPTHILATVFLALVLLKTFFYSVQKKSYLFYYFYVDGLMIVSLIAHLIM
jgi:4-hydroxybenzoate polyprenyltransferase